MEKSFIEKRIEEKAVKRFEAFERETLKFIGGNKLLSNIHIFVTPGKEKYFKLFSENGYCPSTDLFNVPVLLNKNTNYQEIRERIISDFIKEETDLLLSKLETIKDFLE